MYISMNWIGDFVDLSGLDKQALIHRFTLSTAEVEDVYVKGADTYGVVVARIASIENHPNSKKLHLLKIDVGEEALIDCVCGAPNVYEGMRVAFCREGGAVCGNPITRATVGGYESCGMCCSEKELGISDDHGGLMEITDDIPLGTDLKSVYAIDDIVFEVDNKSLTNRPDLWGHYGIAREFATLAGRALRPVPVEDMTAYDSLPPVAIDIREPELCYRYIGVKAENITRHQSPVNMRIRLFYCGSRAINLLADLTNYVMLELGQPMHAFDLRRVDKIEVQRFSAPFDFETLDGNTRHMDDSMLMITSGEVPVAVAGVMGGLASEIEDDTTSLLLESASFNGVSVRKTGQKLGLRTDASARYEKMLDPELTMTASARFIYLLRECDGGARVISRLTDSYAYRYPEITLEIDKAYVDRYTGIDISADRIEQTLTALGFGVTRNGDAFTVKVPSWRSTKDVTIKADLIEEITRIYGYDNFEIRTTKSALYPVRAEQNRTDDSRVKDLLVSRYTMHEIHSYIWCDAAKYKELGIEVEKNVDLVNAQTPEHTTLRYSMIPTLLCCANENKGFDDTFGIFEIGRVVMGLREDGACNERKKLGLLFFSRTESEETLFLRARDAVSEIIRNLRHEDAVYSEKAVAHSFEHPANTYAVSFGGVEVGMLGVPHPAVRANMDKKANVAFAELDMDVFSATKANALAYKVPSRFPGIDIDLTFSADIAKLNFPQIAEKAKAVAGEWLTEVTLAGVYETEEGATVTVRYTFASPERTLSKAELAPMTDAVIAAYADLGLQFQAI